jgi:Ras-related protein Rab-5C
MSSNHNSNAHHDELLQEIESARSEWGNIRNRTRNYKTVLLGACGAGKSSLVSRHILNTFDPTSDSTIGASFRTSGIMTSVGEIKLNIWDTAGQERYDSLIPMYYREAEIAFVVFDLTEPYSFERAQHWIKILEDSKDDTRANNKNIDIILIGNKIDKEQHLTDCLIREGQTYSDEKNIPFVLASAKTGCGVVELFATAINRKLKREDDSDIFETSYDDKVSLSDVDGKSHMFTSCIGIPSVLTYSYWKGDPIPLTDDSDIADEEEENNAADTDETEAGENV